MKPIDDFYSGRLLVPPVCPGCDARIDGFTFPGTAPGTQQDTPRARRGPAAGDMTVCSYCRIVLVFTADLQLRLPTQADLDELDAEDRRKIAWARLIVDKIDSKQPPPAVKA